MKNLGTVYSAVEPKPIEVLETKVFVASDIRIIDREVEDGTIQEYEYTLTEYDKDEYIHLMAERNTALDSQLVDTQLALVDVYEMILEG